MKKSRHYNISPCFRNDHSYNLNDQSKTPKASLHGLDTKCCFVWKANRNPSRGGVVFRWNSLCSKRSSYESRSSPFHFHSLSGWASSHVFGSASYQHRRSDVRENIFPGHLNAPWATIYGRATGNGSSKMAKCKHIAKFIVQLQTKSPVLNASLSQTII